MKSSKYFFIVLLLFTLIYGCKEKTSTVPNSVEDESTYTSAHQLHEEKNAALSSQSESDWSGTNVQDSTQSFTYVRDSSYKTFGWHPYSQGDTYLSYNFDLLWGIAYFAYSVDTTTGGYESVHDWKTTVMIDSAKAHGCKVFLSISNFGFDENKAILRNPERQQTLIDSVAALLKEREADGINLDFEEVSESDTLRFTNFIVDLSTQLKAIDSNYQISVALYAVDWNGVFDIATIDAHIDFYTLMGYDYYGSWSSKAGPISPLYSSSEWGAYSVEWSVNNYFNKGVVKSKLIVGLPYYGAEWEVKTDTVPSEKEKYISHHSYKTVQRDFIDSLGYVAQFDSISASAYLRFEEDSTNHQIWYDNAYSLGKKYDWVKSQGLAGISIWSLGYDNGYSELWEVMGEKFGQKKIEKPNVLVVPTANGYEYAMLNLDIEPKIEEFLKKDTFIELKDFPYSKMNGSGFHGVYREEDCTKIIQNSNAEYLIMIRMNGATVIPEIIEGKESLEIGFETKILNTSTMEEWESISSTKNASYEDMVESLKEKMPLMLEQILEDSEKG